MLLRHPNPQGAAALGAAVVIGLALLTVYCQLWSGEERVPVEVSFRWAVWTLATWTVFAAIIWRERDLLAARLEHARIKDTAIALGVVFANVLMVALGYYLLGAMSDGREVLLQSLQRWLITRLPLLLLVALAVTALAAALSWRRRPANAATQAPGLDPSPTAEGWVEFPETPHLRFRSSDVALIRTARNYCELEVAGRLVLVRVTAKELEQRLAPHGFVRVHRGAIVNLSRVRVVQRGRSGRLRLLLDDGSEIAVSRRHREPFSRRLGGATRSRFGHDRAA